MEAEEPGEVPVGQPAFPKLIGDGLPADESATLGDGKGQGFIALCWTKPLRGSWPLVTPAPGLPIA